MGWYHLFERRGPCCGSCLASRMAAVTRCTSSPPWSAPLRGHELAPAWGGWPGMRCTRACNALPNVTSQLSPTAPPYPPTHPPTPPRPSQPRAVAGGPAGAGQCARLRQDQPDGPALPPGPQGGAALLQRRRVAGVAAAAPVHAAARPRQSVWGGRQRWGCAGRLGPRARPAAPVGAGLWQRRRHDSGWQRQGRRHLLPLQAAWCAAPWLGLFVRVTA